MNITYLLGAGASYNALPIVEKIPKELQNFADDFDLGNTNDIIYREGSQNNLVRKFLSNFQHYTPERETWVLKIEQFYNDILWLKNEASNHASIDTFAKKLYLRNDLKNLNKLKSILSCFFLYLQTKKFDNRYDSFFASILDDISKLPENIKIVSWNYDSQIEYAFSNFSNEPIDLCRNSLNLRSKGDNITTKILSFNEFSIHKINGTTNFRNEKYDIEDIISDFNIGNNKMIKTFLNAHNNIIKSKYSPNMSFAWEKPEENNRFFTVLKDSISKTEMLIVIGYSFPFFNKNIDKELLDSMPNLKKIYVQDPTNADTIIEKIKGLVPKPKGIVNGGNKFPQFEKKRIHGSIFHSIRILNIN